MTSVALGSPVTAITRLSLYELLTLPALFAQAVFLASRLPLRRTAPLWYHRQCCRVLGVVVQRRGRQSRRHPTLYVSNHVSYVDISVLGKLIRGSFVAKVEMREWPFFGWLARLQRTVFVKWQAGRSAVQRDEMVSRLEGGDDLILFPEGTSGDGNRVLPFKSALFSVVERWPGPEPLAVQPVSITYARLDGLPLGRHLRPFYAWYGDMDLLPHLWHLAGLGRVTVVVEFHSPVTLAGFGSRKSLAEHCQCQVARGVAGALSGRPRRESTPSAAESTTA